MIRHRFGGNLRAARACDLCAVRHVPPLASLRPHRPAGRPSPGTGHRTTEAAGRGAGVARRRRRPSRSGQPDRGAS